MRCMYKDDFKVDYSGGSLHVTKGRGVELIVMGDQIPANYKACLDSAVIRSNCHELRSAARGIANTFDRAFNIE